MDFSSDDDLHICGKCKQGFSRLDEWLHHKRAKACVDARSNRRLKRGAAGMSQAAQSEPRGNAAAAVAQQQELVEHKMDDDDEDDDDEDDEDDDEASHNRADGIAEQHSHGGGGDSSSCSATRVNGRAHNGGTGGGGGGGRGAGDEDDDDDDDDGDEDGEDDDDGASSSNGDSRGQAADIATLGGQGGSNRSIITRNLFPIVPCIRKRERPGAVDAGCSSPGSGGYSPTGEPAQPRSVKRKRGYPQRHDASGPTDDVSQPAAIALTCFSGIAQPIAATPAHDGVRPLGNGSGDSASTALLPPVYKCERCRKGFMKLSHLHRHMNKKNPCKPRMEGIHLGAGCQMMDGSPLSLNLSLGSMVGTQLSSASHLLASQGPTPTGAAVGYGDSLLASRKPFCCSICHLDCGSYDAVVNHHSMQHQLFYPGYCRFCGRYCDKKNELLIHLSTHDSTDIVEDVAAEMKRVRQTKIDRHGSTSIAGTVVTPSSGRPPAFAGDMPATCAVCSAFCEKETDVLVHHNGCHTPVGLCATLADLRRGRAGSGDGGPNSAGAHSQWKNCFICCLKFTEGSEFEDHIIYHRTWISPHDHAADVSSLQALSVRERSSADGEGSFAPKGDLRAIATRSSSGGISSGSSHLSSGTVNGCSSEKGTSGSAENGLPWSSTRESSLRALVCWLCTKPFAQYEAWRWHLSGDHGLRPVYQCVHDPCRRVFEAWHELAAHSREHAQHAFICAVCNRHSATHGALLAHAELHRSLGAPWFQPAAPAALPLAPPLALQAAEGAGLTSSSLSAYHAAAQSSAAAVGAATATCAHCDQTLADQQQLDAHVDICRRQYVPCLDCGEEVHKSRLVQHVASGHMLPHQQHQAGGGGGGSSDGSGSGDAKRFACDLCTSAFPVRERLTQHIKNVHGPRKYVCQVCGAAFKRSDKLKRHFSLHSDDRPYVCPHPSCGRGFKRADGLRAHARYHEPTTPAGGTATAGHDGSGPYACTHCDAAFESQTSYALHLRLDHHLVTAMPEGDGATVGDSVKREQHPASAY